MWKVLSLDQFIEKARKKHSNKYNYSKVNYIRGDKKVTIICPDHGEFEQTPGNHLAGRGCIKCRNEYNSKFNLFTTEQFIKRSKVIHNNKYDYSKSIYSGKRNLINIICPVHGEFSQLAGNHLQGRGCSKCHFDNKKLTTEQFIERANKVHNNKYIYSKVIYKGCFNKLNILCPIHGEFEQVSNYHLQGNGCPKCDSSKGENIIRSLLDKHNIQYIQEYRIPDQIYKFRYDFYLQELNVLIEFHGKQHFKPIEYFGGIETFNYIRKNDLFKKELAKLSNIPLIEFNYKHLQKFSEKEFEELIINSITKLVKKSYD